MIHKRWVKNYSTVEKFFFSKTEIVKYHFKSEIISIIFFDNYWATLELPIDYISNTYGNWKVGLFKFMLNIVFYCSLNNVFKIMEPQQNNWKEEFLKIILFQLMY